MGGDAWAGYGWVLIAGVKHRCKRARSRKLLLVEALGFFGQGTVQIRPDLAGLYGVCEDVEMREKMSKFSACCDTQQIVW